MFNLSLTACSFHLRKTNSRGNTKIFNLNMPLTLQKEDGTECYFQDLSEIFVQFFKTHESLVKDDNKQQSFRCEYNEDNILENDTSACSTQEFIRAYMVVRLILLMETLKKSNIKRNHPI